MCLRTNCLRLLGTAVLLSMLAARPAQASEHADTGLDRDSAAYRAVRDLLPRRFRELETRRYLVLSDAEVGWTRQQAELLERAHHQFHTYCRRMNLEPRPLRHKLVAVIFDDRDEYRRFATEHDDVADPSLSGYYSPKHDRVVIYNVETNPSVATARSQLAEMHDQIDGLSLRISEAVNAHRPETARTLRRVRGEYRRHWAEQKDLVDAYARQTSVATTVHEAIHQLMFHTDVQSPGVTYPLWISEGLATAFETDEPRSAFGPGHEFDPRRNDFRALLEQGALMPLRELVTIARLSPSQPEHPNVLYHQSYALVHWLSRRRPAQLRRYLDAMRTRRGRMSPAAQLATFEDAFGDVDELERAWLRDERSS